ncbi:hypothetical protein P6Z26_02880, partial [Enterococcus faecium]|uniref:hypothetical protein n=1 Tax=Enterococcus faecium TaxID=1352 RepID=UPI00288E60C2
LWLKTLYRKRAVTWPFIFYTIIWTLSKNELVSKRTNVIYFLSARLFVPFFIKSYDKEKEG